MSEIEIELKPCPICGSRDLGEPPRRSLRTKRVKCLACGSAGAECHTALEAAQAWNRRANEDIGLADLGETQTYICIDGESLTPDEALAEIVRLRDRLAIAAAEVRAVRAENEQLTQELAEAEAYEQSAVARAPSKTRGPTIYVDNGDW